MITKLAAVIAAVCLSVGSTQAAVPEPRKCTGLEERAIAEMICAEAGDAPLICRLALAAVVFNRVDSPDYPDNVLAVLADRGAFPNYDASAVVRGSDMTEVMRIVYAAEYGMDPSFGATSFSHEPTDSGVLHLAAGGMFFYGR